MDKQPAESTPTRSESSRPTAGVGSVETAQTDTALPLIAQQGAPPPNIPLLGPLFRLQRHVGNQVLMRTFAAPPAHSNVVQRAIEMFPNDYLNEHLDNDDLSEEALKPHLAAYFDAPVGSGGASFRDELQAAYRAAVDEPSMAHLATLEDIYQHQYRAGEFFRAQSFLDDLANYINKILDDAKILDDTPAIPDVAQGMPLNEIFEDKVAQIKPDWISLKAHGANPRNNHAFVYRFTSINQEIWQKSHLGKEIAQEKITPEELTNPPRFPAKKITQEEREEIRKKQGIAKRWQILQGILEPSGPFGFTDEAKKRIRAQPAFIKTEIPKYQKLLEKQQEMTLEYTQLRQTYELTYPKLPETAREVQNFFDSNKNTLPPPQISVLQPIYTLSGKLYYLESEIDALASENRIFTNLPKNVAQAAEFLAYMKKMELALIHFGGDTDHSLFVSTAADYELTARSDDRIMQSIIRSDENLENTDDWDFADKGRAGEKQRAPHLVRYEIPLNLLVSPEQVEQAMGLGSSDNEGLVAMRNIKERLFLGDNLDDFIVAVAPNPY